MRRSLINEQKAYLNRHYSKIDYPSGSKNQLLRKYFQEGLLSSQEKCNFLSNKGENLIT